MSTMEQRVDSTEEPSFCLDWICAQIDQGYNLSFIAKSLGYKRAQLWGWIDACPDRQRVIRKKLKGRPHPTPEHRELMRAELARLRLKIDAYSWYARYRQKSDAADILNVPRAQEPAHERQEDDDKPKPVSTH